MKRLFAIILAVILCATLAAGAVAEESEKVELNYFTWKTKMSMHKRLWRPIMPLRTRFTSITLPFPLWTKNTGQRFWS